MALEGNPTPPPTHHWEKCGGISRHFPFLQGGLTDCMCGTFELAELRQRLKGMFKKTTVLHETLLCENKKFSSFKKCPLLDKQTAPPSGLCLICLARRMTSHYCGVKLIVDRWVSKTTF